MFELERRDGRREAHEGREARERLAKREAEGASSTRKRLEFGSPSAGRRDFAGMLNKMVSESASREMPGLVALAEIRKAQRLAGRSPSAHNRAHEQFAKAPGGESFNRLFPRNKMADAAPVAANTIGEDDARSQRYTPDLEAKRLLDAAGRLASTRDYWPSGKPEAIAAEWLLTAARALVAAERERQART